MSPTHVRRVKLLYKTILRLHRGLPRALQDLGDNYVKDEFKRHKKCTEKEAQTFMNEWAGYAISIADQMGLRGKPKPITELGSPLNEEMLECFRTEQILQLYELLKASEVLESDPKAAKPNKKS